MANNSWFQMSGDPNKQAGEFVNLPPGDYTALGIEEVLTKDNSGNPTLTPDNFGRLVIRFRLRMMNIAAGTGAVVSATLPEFYAWVAALGAKVNATRVTRQYPAVMADHAQRATGKALPVKVNAKGFISTKMNPPEGVYTLRFVQAERPDHMPGNLLFQEITSFGKVVKQLIFTFEITDDSLWNGYQINEWIDNPWIKEYEDDDQVITARSIGRPIFTRTANGAIPKFVYRWMSMIQWFALGIENHEWITDPMQTSHGFSEVEEPQLAIIPYMQKAADNGHTVKIFYGVSEASKYPRLQFNDEMIRAFNAALAPPKEAVVEEVKEVAPFNGVAYFIAAMQRWYPVLAAEYVDVNRTDVITFTDTGKKVFADEALARAWARLSWGKRRPLQTLSQEEMERLVAELDTELGAPENPGW